MNKFSKTLACVGVGLVSAPVVVPLAFATYVSYKATQFAFKHYKITAAGLLGAGALMYAANNDSFKENLAQGTNMIHEQYHAAQIALDEKKFEYQKQQNTQKIQTLEDHVSLLTQQNEQLSDVKKYLVTLVNTPLADASSLTNASDSFSSFSSPSSKGTSFSFAQNSLLLGLYGGLLSGLLVGGGALYLHTQQQKRQKQQKPCVIKDSDSAVTLQHTKDAKDAKEVLYAQTTNNSSSQKLSSEELPVQTIKKARITPLYSSNTTRK